MSQEAVNEINEKEQKEKVEEEKEDSTKKKEKESPKLNAVLFVHGLDKRVDETMIYKLFTNYSVVYIKLAKEGKVGRSLGYAFVGFKNREKAEQALREVNYSRLMNKTVRLAWYDREIGNAREKPENNVFVKNIPKNVSCREFHEFFAQYGNIVSAKVAEDEEGDSLGYGFVLYYETESAKKAIEQCHGKPWKDSKMKLYVCQLEKKRPRKPLRFNNLYVRNIPKDWDEEKLKNYFSTYGEISSLIIRSPIAEKLHKNTPRCIYNNIVQHKYGFVCFKSIDGPAEKAVAKVPYMKLTDVEYNKKAEEYAQIFREIEIKEDDVYKCACYTYEEKLEEKMSSRVGQEEIKRAFQALMEENEGFYVVRNLEDRLYCCQALKKKDREKRLRILCEKLKNKVRARYKFCNLYVKNLPDDFDKETLMQLFGKYGGIRAAKIVHITKDDPNYQFIKGKSHCYAFICFVTPDSAKKAKKNLNGKIFIENGPRLFVDYHQTKKERVEFLKLQMMRKVQNNPYKYYIKPLLQINQANPAFSLDKLAPITNPPFPLPLPMPLQMARPQNPQMPNVPQSVPIALVDVQNPQHAKAYMQISQNILRANENYLNAQKAANAQNIPYDPNAQYAQNVPKTQMNMESNEQYKDTIALSNKIFSKLLDDARFIQYQHLFPKIVKILMKNYRNDIDTILNDDQAFVHNMNIIISQAQKETEVESKYREQQINEQRRTQGQDVQSPQTQGLNLYNMGYQQFLQQNKDKDKEESEGKYEELDPKSQENIERLLVEIDYYKHQKNKDGTNDDKSK